MAEDPVTQKDFDLFKQEMRSDFRAFQDRIISKFELYLSEVDKKVEGVINNRINFMAGVVIALVGFFIFIFTWYFDLTYNSINQVNHERARFELEKVIKETLEQTIKTNGDKAPKDKARSEVVDKAPKDKPFSDNLRAVKKAKKKAGG